MKDYICLENKVNWPFDKTIYVKFVNGSNVLFVVHWKLYFSHSYMSQYTFNLYFIIENNKLFLIDPYFVS